MSRVHSSARMSVNKLGEYMDAKAARRRAILREQKYPKDYITAYYKDAHEAITHFLAGNMEDHNILKRQMQLLDQRSAKSVRDGQRLKGNIEALEAFSNLTGKIDLKGARPRLGGHRQPKLRVSNVEISVEPDIILTTVGMKGKQLVGGVKLHFPKTHPLSEDACAYIGAAMHMHHDAYHQNDGEAHPGQCIVIDVLTQRIMHGISAVRQKQKDIEATCDEIARLWPSISPG